MGQLTPELQKYYEDRLDMFSTKAWKELMVDVRGMMEATDKVSSIKDEKDLYFRQGELSIMRWILSIQQVSEDAYEGLRNENAA